jgi:hypothetical protein
VEPSFEIVAPSWNNRDRLYPAVAFGGSSALVIWQHAWDYTNYLDICGQLVWPFRTFLPLVMR